MSTGAKHEIPMPVIKSELGTFEFFWLRRISAAEESPLTALHLHSHIEIHYTLSGRAEYRTADGKICSVPEGKFLFLPQKTLHETSFVTDDFTKFVVGFAAYDCPEQLESALEEKTFPEVFCGNAAIEKQFDVLYDMCSCMHEPFGAVTCAVSALLFMFADVVYTSLPLVKAPQRDSGAARRMIRAYVLDNMSRGVSCEDVASYMCLSSRQLSRLVKKSTDLSLGAFIGEIKISAAKTLLSETDMSVSDVSERCGFGSEYSFMRFFKTQEKITPTEFRKSCLK